MRVIIFLLTTLCTEVLAGQSNDCSPILVRARTLVGHWTNQTEGRRRIQRTWEPDRFTDPSRHTPGNFRYFIKTIGRNVNLETLEPSVESIHVFAKQLKNSKPFSGTVITESLQGTYGGGWGVILSVPPENIISSMLADTDAIPGPMSQGALEDLFSFHGLYDLDAFVEESIQLRRDISNTKYWDFWSYNEVKFVGGEFVYVIGIILDLTKNINNRDLASILAEATKVAHEMRLPLVPLRLP